MLSISGFAAILWSGLHRTSQAQPIDCIVCVDARPSMGAKCTPGSQALPLVASMAISQVTERVGEK